jgi:hypothetical protein
VYFLPLIYRSLFFKGSVKPRHDSQPLEVHTLLHPWKSVGCTGSLTSLNLRSVATSVTLRAVTGSATCDRTRWGGGVEVES